MANPVNKTSQTQTQQTTAQMPTSQAKLRTAASKRIPRALAAISSVGSLGKYKPTENQQRQILEQLQMAFQEAQRNLKGYRKPVSQFSLSD